MLDTPLPQKLEIRKSHTTREQVHVNYIQKDNMLASLNYV